MTNLSHDELRDLDRMRPPAEARALIDATLTQVSIEHIPITAAAGRVLASDLVATEPHPRFPASTMDGFAVLAADSSPWREIIGEQAAGSVIDAEVTEGYTVRIMTGAPVPLGADAVVPVEATELMVDHVVVHQEDVKVGENIRPIGSDVQAGDVVLRAGTVLTPATIGLAASLGRNTLEVRRRVRASVLSTGDELVDPGGTLAPGQIFDANRFSLAAALLAEGCEITWTGKAPDQRDQLEALLNERMDADDIVITSGGVSMGEKDLIKAILISRDDISIHFRRLYLKPGKPLNFATRGSTLIFGLPGNPVSSLVTFEVFIRPAIRTMLGATEVDRPLVPVALEHGVNGSDRIEYQRGIVSVQPDGTLSARNTGGQMSSRLQSFVGMNALVVIPPRETPYAAGEIVRAMLIEPPFAAAAQE